MRRTSSHQETPTSPVESISDNAVAVDTASRSNANRKGGRRSNSIDLAARPIFGMHEFWTPSPFVRYERTHAPARYIDVAHSFSGEPGDLGGQTDLLRAENAWLRAECERYVQTIGITSQGAWEIDVATNSISLSPDIAKMLGFESASPEEDLRRVSECSDPMELKLAHDLVTKYIRGVTQECRYESKMRHRDGTTRWWTTYATAVRDADGNPMRILGFVTDTTKQRAVENMVEEAAVRFRALFESLPLPMYICDAESMAFLDVNDAMVEQYGYTRDEFLAMSVSCIRPPEDIDDLRRVMTEVASSRTVQAGVWRHLRKDGTLLYSEITCVAIQNNHGRSELMIMARDVTDQLAAQRAIAESELRFRSLFENATEGIYQSSLEGSYLRVNPALARMYDFESPDELMHMMTNLSDSLYVNEGRRAEFVQLMIDQGKVENFVSQIYCKNRRVIWISENARCVRGADGAIQYFEGTVENITERIKFEVERERMLQEALERADCDPLTGLLNHRAFHKRLEEEADRAQRMNLTLAVAVLDLDNFKFFNDAYGHVAGDAVLRTVAENLRICCRSYDILARFGGDEFAVLMPDVSPEATRSFEERVSRIMEESGFQPEGYDAKIPLGVTVGVALFPTEAHTRQEIIEMADERLRRAKNGGDQHGVSAQLRSSYLRNVSGFKILDSLVTAVDTKDRYTRKHSEDVMLYCLDIAEEMGIKDEIIETLKLSALLHDVGKIGVPHHILRKPGRLTPEEHAAIQQHAAMGAIIVSAVPGFSQTLDGIRYHHERWDGQGYPDGLAGTSIPLLARIMAVADAFSAMTTNRPYRCGMSHGQALSILTAGSGGQWDPECVTAFVRRRSAALRAAAGAVDEVQTQKQ